MLTHLDIDPVMLELGPLAIHWYGFMYLLGFIGAYGLCWRKRLQAIPPWEEEDITDLFFYSALGVIFGGTWGYIFFYEPELLWKSPVNLLTFWKPGRSFHGGLLGVLLAILYYSYSHHRSFWAVTDFIAPAVPIGLATGRLGNFLNGELWGRVTDIPWSVVFPQVDSLPRHPSQLYEALLEGVLLLVLLQWYTLKPRAQGTVSGLFLLGYGLFRFIVEFFREPDHNQGYVILNWLTKGQLFSFPMIILGISIFIFFIRKGEREGRS